MIGSVGFGGRGHHRRPRDRGRRPKKRGGGFSRRGILHAWRGRGVGAHELRPRAASPLGPDVGQIGPTMECHAVSGARADRRVLPGGGVLCGRGRRPNHGVSVVGRRDARCGRRAQAGRRRGTRERGHGRRRRLGERMPASRGRAVRSAAPLLPDLGHRRSLHTGRGRGHGDRGQGGVSWGPEQARPRIVTRPNFLF